MPDPITTPPTGTDPKPPVTANSNASAFDPSKLSDEEFAKVFDDGRLFKHDRFKSLAEAKKERDELKANQAKIDEDKLRANQEFEKLANKNAKERDEFKTKAEQAEINAEIVRIAAQKGAVNLANIKKLIDRGNIKLDESGTIIGAEEAVDALAKESPELFNEKGTPNIGNGTSPSKGNGGVKRFKLSQLNNARFYRENEKDIQEAMRHGMIDPTG